MSFGKSLILLLVSVGCALGNETNCPVQAEGKTVYDILEDRMTLCMFSAARAHLNRLYEGTVREVRSAPKKYRHCAELASIERCMNQVTTLGESCLEGVNRTRLSLDRLHQEVILEVGCVRGGERLALINTLSQQFIRSNGGRTVISQCHSKAIYANVDLPQREDDPNSKMRIEYRTLLAIEECLQEQDKDNQLVALDLEVTQEILDRILCVQPEDKALVPCKSISALLLS